MAGYRLCPGCARRRRLSYVVEAPLPISCLPSRRRSPIASSSRPPCTSMKRDQLFLTSQKTQHASQTLPAPSCQLPSPRTRLEAKRAHSILLAGHVPHRSKPYRQGKMGVLKHGSREHRHLRPTACAKPKSARNRPSILALASRATKACRPAQREKILPTRGIVGKAPLQFHQCARIILGHSRPLYLGVG